MENVWYILLTAGLVDLSIVVILILFGARLHTFRQRRHEQRWTNMQFGSELHRIPQYDLMEHRVTDHCACSPRRIPGKVSGYPTVLWKVQHIAADGRKTR